MPPIEHIAQPPRRTLDLHIERRAGHRLARWQRRPIADALTAGVELERALRRLRGADTRVDVIACGCDVRAQKLGLFSRVEQSLSLDYPGLHGGIALDADAMDVFAELTVHPKKFKEENAVLAAMREVILAQGIQPSPLAVVGTIVTGLSGLSAARLDNESATVEASSTGAQLHVLYVACKGVPTAVLQRRAEQMIGALSAAIARHAETPSVLKPATSCAGQLLRALGGNAVTKPASDAQRLHRWLLALALSANAKVRSKAQHTAAMLARSVPALGAPTGKFIVKQLEGAKAAVLTVGGGELQSLFYALNLCAQVLPALPAATARAVVVAVSALPSLRQPLLTQVAADALLPALGGGHAAAAPAGDEDDVEDDDDAAGAGAMLPADIAIGVYAAFAAVKAEGTAEPRPTVLAATRTTVRAACCALRAAAASGELGLAERACAQAKACVALLLVRMQHDDEAIAKPTDLRS
ncbi:hypothetical protein T492DRAFT_891906 [Pavlovales sp. CCMP2436]|nr:hypothetical protein T492DRAFT_891906 [Pavlovales sp. CCMP2436]